MLKGAKAEVWASRSRPRVITDGIVIIDVVFRLFHGRRFFFHVRPTLAEARRECVQ